MKVKKVGYIKTMHKGNKRFARVSSNLTFAFPLAKNRESVIFYAHPFYAYGYTRSPRYIICLHDRKIVCTPSEIKIHGYQTDFVIDNSERRSLCAHIVPLPIGADFTIERIYFSMLEKIPVKFFPKKTYE